MSEPLRLRDPRSRASAELRSLLGHAEPPTAVPPAARERVRRALAQRAAASERKAVCWSHAFGLALALATCLAWLLPQRTRDAEPSVATPRRVLQQPAADQSVRVPVQSAMLPAVAASEPAAPAAHVPEQRKVVAKRSAPSRRATAAPARSRKRIQALVAGIMKPEAQLLDRARREAERDPEHALALIEAFRREHPRGVLPAPIAVAEVDALRRLGRFEEALAKARALLEGSRKPYYADVMAERFALLDL